MSSSSFHHQYSEYSNFCLSPQSKISQFKTEKDLRTLIDENLEYYCEITDLQKAISIEKDEKESLQNRIAMQERVIQKLTNQTSQTREDELEMASEILRLKRDLARERKKNEKIAQEPRRQVEKDVFPSLWEAREKALLDRLKEARETNEINRQEAERSFLKVLTAEEDRDHLVVRLEQISKDNKELVAAIADRETLKGMNEALESQLREMRAEMAEQIETLERLRKENFQLLRRPLSVIVEPETSHENLEIALQLQLRRRIDRLETENQELETKLKQYKETANESIEEDKMQCDNTAQVLAKQKLDGVSDKLSVEKSVSERLRTDLQQLKSQLALAEHTLTTETVKWTLRMDQMEKRMKKAQEERDAAENSLKVQGSSKNEIINELCKSKALIEDKECLNRTLKAEIDALNAKLEEQKQDGIQLRKELEESVKPEITQLQELLRAEKSFNERLRGDLELKEFLLKEETAVAAQTRAKLDKAQQRLEESETRITQSSRLTSDQAERLAKSESSNKQKDSEIKELKKKFTSLEKTITQLEVQLDTSKGTYTRLSQEYESLESRYILSGDDNRRLLSDVAFYRQELEKLAEASTTQLGYGAKSREGVLQSVLDALQRQIDAAKNELELLSLDLNEQIKKLPIQKKREASNEFEIVHIVEHFQKEKRKVSEELRSMTLLLSNAENSHQALLDKHHSLKRSHIQTLKELLELKESSQNLNVGKTMIDIGIGTDNSSCNSLKVISAPSTELRAGVDIKPTRAATQSFGSHTSVTELPLVQFHVEADNVLSEECEFPVSDTPTQESLPQTSPHPSLRASDTCVRQRPLLSETPAKKRPSLRSPPSTFSTAVLKEGILDKISNLSEERPKKPANTSFEYGLSSHTPLNAVKRSAEFEKRKTSKEADSIMATSEAHKDGCKRIDSSGSRQPCMTSLDNATGVGTKGSLGEIASRPSSNVTPLRPAQANIERPSSAQESLNCNQASFTSGCLSRLLGTPMTSNMTATEQKENIMEKQDILKKQMSSESTCIFEASTVKKKTSRSGVQARATSRTKRMMETHKIV